jgi:RNA polymerase sigma-70 factor (family 1)
MSDPFYSNEEEILERLRKGDEVAFKKIFKRYWRGLYADAYSKIGSHEEAEEIIESVFCVLWEKRETLVITNLHYYLHTAVRNRFLNCIRSKIPQQKYWDYYKKFIPQVNETTEHTVFFDDLSDAFDQALKRLPEKSRDVFRMNRLEGRTIAEVAGLMKLSPKTIEYHLSKSLKVLRVYLKDFIAIMVALPAFF